MTSGGPVAADCSHLTGTELSSLARYLTRRRWEGIAKKCLWRPSPLVETSYVHPGTRARALLVSFPLVDRAYT